MKRMLEYGSEFDWQANKAFSGGGEIPDDWQLFRSGRDALRAFARLAGRKRVLLPALCCESMILPFVQNGYEPVFYRMKENLSADEEDLLGKCRRGDVLLFMRYFGVRPFPGDFLADLRAEKDLLMLEDRTHDILVRREADGFQADAVAASLRKWAALPEGGMLKTALGRISAKADSAYGDLRFSAMKEKSLYLETGNEELRPAYLEKLRQAESLLDRSEEPVAMSPRYEEILQSIDFSAIHAARVHNLKRLQARLEVLFSAGIVHPMTPEPEKSGLYLPLLVSERDRVQRELIRRRIYCPAAIWPEPEAAAGVCPVSLSITEHMLSVLCDQRCRETDIDFIAENLIEILRQAGEIQDDD